MAKGYYPRLWPMERLDELVKAGRLTQAEREEIAGTEEVKDMEKAAR